MQRPECLVSIHDVMPETLDPVDNIITQLNAADWAPASLLVVPGRGWDASSIARLRQYVDAGHMLVAHGWSHSVPQIRGVFHKLHSLILSRNAAEHLALDETGIEALMRRSKQWFQAQRLPVPTMYVPPAWALGGIRRKRLAGAGFRFVETLAGIRDTRTGRLMRIPVLGYEADTAVRAAFLRFSNYANMRLGRKKGLVRVAIHPYDLKLRLADDLRRTIQAGYRSIEVERIAAAAGF